jgi:toxin ParE1/3/4
VSAVRFLPEAEAEYLHEVSYYSSVRPGYGIRFKDAVKTAAARLLVEPLIGTPAPEDTRKVRIKGFPLSVVYRGTATELLIVAIAADRRRPNYWVRRVGGRRG